MCLTHDSNPRAACGLKGPFRLVKVVYTHTHKQTTWSRPRLQDRSPTDIVVKSYKSTYISHVDGPTLNKASRLTWNNFAAGHVSIQNADFPGTSWKSVNLGSFRCHLSSAHAQGHGARSPKWTPLENKHDPLRSFQLPCLHYLALWCTVLDPKTMRRGPSKNAIGDA